MCPKSNHPFYIVSYYITWVITSWTYSTYIEANNSREAEFDLVIMKYQIFANFITMLTEFKYLIFLRVIFGYA